MSGISARQCSLSLFNLHNSYMYLPLLTSSTMAQTRKTPTSMPKVSFTLTGARRKVTAISKSGKENIMAQPSSVTKVTTTSSTRPKPVVKPVNKSRPLQARTSSSQDEKDADTAALLAMIAQQQGLSIHFFLIL